MDSSRVFVFFVLQSLLNSLSETHTIKLNLQIHFPNPFDNTPHRTQDYLRHPKDQEFQESREDVVKIQVDGRLRKFFRSDSEKTCGIVVDKEYAPKKLKNIAGLERTIVNQVGFLQVIYRELCLNDERSNCPNEVDIFGFTRACVQEYRPVKLVIQKSNLQDSGTSTDWFWIESFCSCKWKKWPNNEGLIISE